MLTSRSRILAEAISMYEVSAWTENSDFMDQIYSKKEFQLQLKFQLKLTILALWAKTDNFGFYDEIHPKKVFPVKNRKSEHLHWIFHIWFTLGIKFHLKLTKLIFRPNLPKKGISGWKRERWRASLNSTYSN